jgi:hypothetical protein
MLIQALSETQIRILSIDLSFNQFFKDLSLHELISYLERKSIEILDAKCKYSFEHPPIAKLK